MSWLQSLLPLPPPSTSRMAREWACAPVEPSAKATTTAAIRKTCDMALPSVSWDLRRAPSRDRCAGTRAGGVGRTPPREKHHKIRTAAGGSAAQRERDVVRLLLAGAQDHDVHRVADLRRAQHRGEVLERLDRTAIPLDETV